MKTLLIVLLSLTSGSAFAKVFVGYNRTVHLTATGLNNEHPYIGYETANYGTKLFKNSYDKISIAGYAQKQYHFRNKVYLNLQVGYTTGYQPIETYNGQKYAVNSYFLTDNVMLIVIPTVNYDYRDLTISAGLFGDAIGTSIQYNFNYGTRER